MLGMGYDFTKIDPRTVESGIGSLARVLEQKDPAELTDIHNENLTQTPLNIIQGGNKILGDLRL